MLLQHFIFAGDMVDPHSRHNAEASRSLHVPWCFAEQDEERAEAVVHVHDITSGGM